MDEISTEIQQLFKKIKPPYNSSIDAGEGWYQLILDCDKELTAIDAKYAILQIKQKFGGLCYYMTPSNKTTPEQRDSMWAILEKYEELSRNTCEETGCSGVLMQSVGGSYKTLNLEYAARSPLYTKHRQVEKTNQFLAASNE
jgi:hypothetical protein